MNPSRDGLPAIEGYRERDADGIQDAFLFRGMERAENEVRRGRYISGPYYAYLRKLIARAKAIEDALDHRELMQRGKDD